MIITKMKKLLIVVFITLACHAATPTCPNNYLPSDIYSAQASLAIGTPTYQPEIALANGVDLYCYNHTLPLPFRKSPSVAISIAEISSSFSPQLSFHVKYVNNQNYQNLSFVIKVNAHAANWIKLRFQFISEIRDDLLLGGYQIGTDFLALCEKNKSQVVLVPYAEKWEAWKNSQVQVFLNGFDIVGETAAPNLNPFEIEIVGVSAEQFGLKVVLAMNSSSKVEKLFLSYVIVNNQTILDDISGLANKYNLTGDISYQILKTESPSLPSLQPADAITLTPILSSELVKYRSIIGLTSFSYENNSTKNHYFNAAIDPALAELKIKTNNLTYKHIAVNYLLIKYQECSGCLGYTLYDNSQNKCASICPSNSYAKYGECLACSIGSHWNGVQCVKCGVSEEWNGNVCLCLQGFYKINGVCIKCPTGTYFNGIKCECPYAGQTFDQTAQKCVCPSGLNLINGQCRQCPQGSIWDGQVCSFFSPCASIPNSFWNGQICQCKNSFAMNSQGICSCDNGFINSSGECIKCLQPNTIWNGIECACNSGFRKTPQGECVSIIMSCPEGQYIDYVNNVCASCGQGCRFCYNSNQCVVCSSGYELGMFGKCEQACGNGIRLKQPCDDGNKISGDGCSSKCEIEPNFFCYGGSPISKDICVPAPYNYGSSPSTNNSSANLQIPSSTVISSTGQSHIYGQIIINLRLNYLPSTLLQNNCAQCSDVIKSSPSVSIPGGVTISYIPSSQYSFSVRFDFGYEPLPKFSALFYINPAYANLFSAVDVSKNLNVIIDPAILSLSSNASNSTTSTDAKKNIRTDALN